MEDNFVNAYDRKPVPKKSDGGTDGKKPKKGKKKISAINIVLYCIAAVLISAGVYMLVNEFWLETKDETQGLITEEEIYPEAETFKPLATPVDNYDIIPVKFHFIDRNTSCDIIPTGIEDDGSMGTVPDALAVTWLSIEPYVVPGDVGNAVLSGHNLWKGKAGTFSLLKKVNIGETVAVTFDKGFTRYFEVVKRYECRYDDTTPMITDGVDEPILTLVTCAGDWSDHLGQSKTRVIVVCKPVN